jgi:hypothetical protein
MSFLVKLDRLIIGLILRSKLVFLISVQPHAAFIEDAHHQVWTPMEFRLHGKCADYILPSVWTLIMRAIKCLKGVRWMPWR